MSNQFNVVMLTTKKASNLLLTKKGVLTQCYAGGERENAIKNGAKCQDVHIVDTKATINVGDWYIDSLTHPNLVSKPLQMTCYYDSDCKVIQSSTGTTSPVATSSKVIASTDTSLGLPEIPQNFIQAYVENQNIKITNVIKYSQNDIHIVLKGDDPLWKDDCNYRSPATREQYVNPKEYNQIPFTEQEQEDFKQVVECSRQYSLLKSNEEEENLFKDMIEMSKSFEKEELQKQQIIEFISLEKQQELWNEWNSYDFRVKSTICSKILNRSSSDCYVDMNDLLYLDKPEVHKQVLELSYKLALQEIQEKTDAGMKKIADLLFDKSGNFNSNYHRLHHAHVRNISYCYKSNTYKLEVARLDIVGSCINEDIVKLHKTLNAKIEIIEHKWY